MGQRRAPVSCRGKRPSWWCIPMTACSAKGLWAVSFSSLAGKLWTLMGQLCEGPRVDTGGCDQGQAVSLPSPELPGLGETPQQRSRHSVSLAGGSRVPWGSGMGASPEPRKPPEETLFLSLS